MKRNNYILSLLLLVVSAFNLAPAYAQQNQYAIYNYRNDGDFNAWLNIDVDSITYSCIDTLGVEHDDVVVQEVWTPDSVYRIPINAIDSLGFRAPKPEYQDNVFHITTEHLPYIVAVDNFTITFYSSLPVHMRPAVGQVVTSDTFEDPLTDGFAGKVLEIKNDGEYVTVICEGANVTDVFKKLILVGKAVAVDENEAKRRPLRGPRKIWGDYEDTGNVEFEFPGKISVKINDFISIEDEVSMAADYYVYVDFPRFKMRATATGTHKLKTKWSIDSDKILEWMGVERDKFEPDWATPFWPVVAFPGVFSFGVKLGGFLDPSVKLSLTGSTPITFTHTFGVEFSNTDTYVMFPIITPIANVHSELGTPEISLSLEGKLFAGIALGLKTKLIADNVVHGDITGRFGPEFDAKIQMKQVFGENNPISWYSLLKDSKVGIQLKADAKVKAKVFGKNMTDKLSWDWKWPIPGWEETRYLFPDFTKPELPHYLMPDPLDMRTTPHRDIIMPIYAGLGIYDEEGTRLRAYYSGEKYHTDAYYQRPPHIFIGDLPAGQKYICQPIFNIPSLSSIGEIKASPVAEFTVPYPVSFETDNLYLQIGKSQRVAINGGWGDYSLGHLNKTACDAELKKEGDKYYVQLFGKAKGMAPITVNDLRSGKSKTLIVDVTEEEVTNLTLSENSVSLQKGDRATVTITSGSGNYTLANSDASVAVAAISNGNQIVIAALKAGTATITVTDTKTKQTATIAVTVTDGTDVSPGEAIDLGLPSGTLWASCNVGATKPEEYGDYFAWGETEEKDYYYWDNYMCEDAECGTTNDPIYTWNGNKLYADIAGSKFDVATSKWGPSWHMPSSAQMDELSNECIWTWCDGEKTKYNGTSVRGYIISSKVNNNKIFLPAAGNYHKDRLIYKNESCLYWSSSQFDGAAFEGETYYTNSNSAIGMDYNSKGTYVDLRFYGQTIRPVRMSNQNGGTGSGTGSGGDSGGSGTGGGRDRN